MGIMVGKYEIKVDRDARGDIVYSLFNTQNQQMEKGSWLSMTAAMLQAAELEMAREMNISDLRFQN